MRCCTGMAAVDAAAAGAVRRAATHSGNNQLHLEMHAMSHSKLQICAYIRFLACR